MNDQFKKEMQERWGYPRGNRHGRLWAGLLLVAIGGLLLLKALQIVLFPWWFFTWPMLLIAFGLLSALKHGLRRGGWMVMLLIGGLFLANEIDPSLDLERFVAPIAVIGVGLIFILRPKRNRWRRWEGDHGEWHSNVNTAAVSTEDINKDSTDSRDFIDITAVFGGVKKNVISKTFKGGDIVTFMGGSEIDMSQADFTGKIKIDTTNIFGGTKLIVPSTWDVQSDITAIFGGVEDKRQMTGVNADPAKILILDGTCLFGGIEIRSF